MKVTDGEFYHVEMNSDEEVFGTREDAAEYISDNSDDIDYDSPDVTMAKVDTSGDEWSIEGVIWQNIVLQLL